MQCSSMFGRSLRYGVAPLHESRDPAALGSHHGRAKMKNGE